MNNLIKTEVINDYMKKNNLTKKDFSKFCNISETTLRKVLSNNGDFNLMTIFKISRAMKVSAVTLLVPIEKQSQ